MGEPPKVQSNNIILTLTKHWVILYSWVCHLKYSLIILFDSNKTLGYTALMGVPLKVQPSNIILALTEDWFILYSWVSHLKYSLIILS